MRFNLLSAIAAVAFMASALSSCSTLPQAVGSSATTSTTTTGNNTATTAASALGSLLDGLIGNNVPVTVQSLAGTWTYKSPEVRFESEEFLSKAGGAVAAASIEQKLSEIYSKAGITPGNCGFTFNEDKTCSIKIGTRTINGKYTLDSSTHDITIQSSTGLLKLNGKVYFGVSSVALLFDADKILSVAQALSAITGNSNSSLATIASALKQYDGLMLGMNLSK